TFTYSQKTRCLKLFQKLVDDHESNEDYAAIYQYFLDIAGPAWELYQRWKSHRGFRGTRLRSIDRENGQVAEVPDGIVFPIIGALSAFVTEGKRAWELKVPDVFEESELIDAAAQAYMDIASHNPQTMGKSKACYSTLLRFTGVYARLTA